MKIYNLAKMIISIFAFGIAVAAMLVDSTIAMLMLVIGNILLCIALFIDSLYSGEEKMIQMDAAPAPIQEPIQEVIHDIPPQPPKPKKEKNQYLLDCPYCSRQFALKSKLQKHIVRNHLENVKT